MRLRFVLLHHLNPKASSDLWPVLSGTILYTLGSQQLSLVDYFGRLMLLLNYSYLNEVSLDSYCYIESKAPKVSLTYEL